MFYREQDFVRVIQVIDGLKIYGDSKEHCIKLQDELNKFRIEIKLGCACDADIWSLYVIYVPDNLVDEYRNIEI